MNTLRRSFIQSLVQDEKLKSFNVTFGELKKIVHLLFIEGEELQLTVRETEVIESKLRHFIVFDVDDHQVKSQLTKVLVEKRK